MAPEIFYVGAYKGTEVDYFALGVILFIMVSKNPPFAKATPEDLYYKTFLFKPE